MAGLLDFLTNDPEQQRAITQGLLSGAFGAMAGRGSRLQAWGQGGLAGLAGYGGSLDRSAMEKQQAAQMQRQALQDQMLRIQLGQAQREQEIASLPQQFLRPGQLPVTMDNRDVGQPGEQNIPQAFDTQGYIQALMGKSPMQALQLQAALQKDNSPLTVKEGETLLDRNTLKPVYSNAKTDKGTSDMQEFAFAQSRGEVPQGMTFTEWMRANKRAGASNTSVSYGNPVQGIDAAGNPVFMQPAKDGKAPYIVPGVRPPMSAAEERLAAEKAAKDKQGQQMLSVLGDAEKILKEGNATGSGAGTVADAVARSVGVTTKGAIDAKRLESLSGWLVANVPRMEGPQSNFDVENYRTMAGAVGDSRIPIKERLAALQEVRKLQQKYAAINGTPVQPQPDANKVRKFNPATGRIE